MTLSPRCSVVSHVSKMVLSEGLLRWLFVPLHDQEYPSLRNHAGS